MGSGPDAGDLGSGFYTTDQYKDILKYANMHHVEVIPEIDFPGHAHAAIASMRARYKKLNNTHKYDQAKQFVLEEESPPQFAEVNDLNYTFNYCSNTVNPCIMSTYRFIEHIVKELVNLHKDITPQLTVHFGGDEVKYDTVIKSDACQKLFVNSSNIKEYYTKKVLAIARKYGVNVHMWEDGAFQYNSEMPWNSSLFEKTPVVNGWRNKWIFNQAHGAYTLANYGYQVGKYGRKYLDMVHGK